MGQCCSRAERKDAKEHDELYEQVKHILEIDKLTKAVLQSIFDSAISL
jgi:hypothetical protein